MNKQEFDACFGQAVDDVKAKTMNNIQDALAKFSNEDGRISYDKLAMFAYTESLAYTDELIYAVLSKILVTE